MTHKTNYSERRENSRVIIRKTFFNLVTLKKENNTAAFNKLLLEIAPEIKKYVVSRLRTAIKKDHISKNKYAPNDFLDQLFIETYDHIDEFSNEDEFYIWLYKKIDELLDDVITEETFDDLFFTNIENYSKQEWKQLEEEFTAESDGDLIMKEELDDISYYKAPYTPKDVFIEHTESALVDKIDKHLHDEEIDRHIETVLHNLSRPMRTVFQLFTKQHLTLEEIAAIQKEPIEKVQELLANARKAIKVSMFNRYDLE